MSACPRYLRAAAFVLIALGAASAQPRSRLVYGTYLTAAAGPGSVDGTPAAIAVAPDPAGGSLVSFTSTEITYVPNQYTAYQFNASIQKLNPDGSQAFSVTLPHAVPTGIAVDAGSNIYVCGAAYGDFPTTPGAFDRASPEGFLAKLDPQGNVLWASRLSAKPYALALDAAGSIFLTGMAMKQFQTTPGAYQAAMRPQECSPDQYGSDLRSCTDAFVAKVSADGTRLLYGTFLGGSREEFGNAVAVDAAGQVYVAGETYSEDFPATPGAYQSRLGGAPRTTPGSTGYIVGGDAFVARLDIASGRLVYATYLGGAGVDFASGLAVDARGNAFVTGTTASSDFPVTAGSEQAQYGGASGEAAPRSGDAFFARLEPDGRPVYASYLGGEQPESATGAVLNAAGRALFLAGAGWGPVCRPTVSIISVDAETGRVADREGVLNLSFPNASLALDASGIVHAAGTAASWGDPFAVTPGNTNGYGTVLLATIHFTRHDEFVPQCAVNAASYAMRRRYGGAPFSVAPGEIVSLFGLGVGPAPIVRLGSRQLPVLYSDASQANLSIPYDVPPGSSVITIERGEYRASYPVEVAGVFPGIFTSDGVHAAALNEDGTMNSAANPAPRGSIVVLYATGLGPVDAQRQTTTPFDLYVEANTSSNAAAMAVLYSGQAPALPVGAYQVNARIPEQAKTGEPLLRLVFGEPWFEWSQDPLRIFVAP